jgi:hypothetical protein
VLGDAQSNSRDKDSRHNAKGGFVTTKSLKLKTDHRTVEMAYRCMDGVDGSKITCMSDRDPSTSQ